MANRRTCVWCRVGVQRTMFAFYSHQTLCPEHKRLRNRLQRDEKATERRFLNG